MKYEIKGAPFPAVICELEKGEQMVTEGGGMSWMSDGLKMDTTTNGGIGKAIGRIFSNDKMFQNIYTALSNGSIAFSSCFPGDIIALNVDSTHSYICQKSSFLASTRGVNMSLYFKKKLGAGLFGGEGFIMQKYDGEGLLFIEVDGSAIKYSLAAGEKMIVSTSHLVMMSETCSMDIQSVKGAKNIFFGGEGLFNTTVTGPGDIVLQTIPISKMAGELSRYLPTANTSGDGGANSAGDFAGGLIGGLFKN